MNNERAVYLHLEDEAPAIGTGLRLCFVAEGERWARVRFGERRVRLPIEEFDRIEEGTEARIERSA